MRYTLLYAALFAAAAAFSVYERNSELGVGLGHSHSKSAKTACDEEKAIKECQTIKAKCALDPAKPGGYVCNSDDGFVEKSGISVGSTACRCFNGRCVSDNRGRNKCMCKPKHALTDEETCQPCDCGSKGNCIFMMQRQADGSIHYTKKCICNKGTAEQAGKCVDCQCGLNSKCEFEDNEKICYCEDGYSEKEGVCTECNCGEYGECKHELDRKVCTCYPGYLVNGDRCEECDCGDHGVCAFYNGVKECQCNDRYQDNEGYCEECECGEHSSGCHFEGGDKTCECEEGYVQKGDFCEEDGCVTKCGEGYLAQGIECKIYSDNVVTCSCTDYSKKFDDGSKSCLEAECVTKCGDGYLWNDIECRIVSGESATCTCRDYLKKFDYGTKSCIEDKCRSVCGYDYESDDVICSIDTSINSASCSCKDPMQTFHYDTKTCKEDKCKIKCGKGYEESRVTCHTFVEDDAHVECSCKDRKQAFDNDKKDCIECECGEHSSGCHFKGGDKTCECEKGYVQKGGFCEEGCGVFRSCANGGLCVDGYCKCSPGTDGDFCEKVEECDHLCEGVRNASCFYDDETMKAFCYCHDTRLRFDPAERMCKVPCDPSAVDACGNGAKCEGDGKNKFCDCLKGTSGDKCEVIDRCFENPNFCGDRNNAKCVYDPINLKADCECYNEEEKFDFWYFMCRVPCDPAVDACGNGAKCEADGENGFCRCLKGTSGEKCEVVDGCIENPNFCGEGNDVQCVYDQRNLKADCRCDNEEEKFDFSKAKCRIPCDPAAADACENGAKCEGDHGENKFCNCLERTGGDKCEVVDGCIENPHFCGEEKNVKCVYDQRNLKAHCKCDNSEEKFDFSKHMCRISCDSRDVCKNGAICRSDGDIKFCECLAGTSGSDCGIIDVCARDQLFCGEGRIDRCAYRPDKLKADCECENENEKFDSLVKECRTPCDPAAADACDNGAKCEGGGENKFCNCLRGTRGNVCEVVDECIENPHLCGDEKNARCVYEQKYLKADCRCDNAEEKFDFLKAKCRTPCDGYDDSCRNGARCVGAATAKFCNCLPGTSGSDCGVVDRCEDHDFCGGKDDAKCLFDTDSLQAICKCHVDGKKFDVSRKMCRIPCDYHEAACKNMANCEAAGGGEFCKCRRGTSGDHCEIVDQCKDDPDFCGEKDDVRCVYDPLYDRATCKCLEEGKKFDDSRKMCRASCNSHTDCGEGGTCSIGKGFCVCVEGYEGERCEVITGCKALRETCMNANATCVFDGKAPTKAICQCREQNTYDPKTNSCKPTCGSDADCGEGGTCSKRICVCMKGYEGGRCDVITGCKTLGDRCRRANATCVFDDAAPGQANCVCRQEKHVYDSDSETCKKLGCTEKSCLDGMCDVVDGEEVCSCREGYVLEEDRCQKLKCSRTACVNGTCIVRSGNVEECVCPAGFTLDKDTCRRGVCRIDTCYGGLCKTVDGELVCVCPRGFHLEGIGCYETVCVEKGCFGGKCVVKDNEEICTCKEGYVLENDVCKKILCEKKSCFGGQCHLVDGSEVCTCPPGFSIFEDVCRENLS